MNSPQATPIDAPAFSLLKALILKKGSLRVRIITGSMTPVIQIGQEVEVKPVQFEELRRFMPIVFHYNDQYLYCHFVWHLNSIDNDRGERVVLTRGIPRLKSKEDIDMPVAESKILGQAVGIKIPWWLRLWIILFKPA